MSLPPALLKRLAQRGLVENQKAATCKEGKDATKETAPSSSENEEVIAENYDEMEEMEHPSVYETSDDAKRPEENFWLERMKLRIGEAGSYAGHKGCPNKYNIYHKCTLYCVNRWGDGHVEPSREYIRRYKRLLRRYPLPKGWTEMYDPGCGCFYFWNNADSMVSWLPPTHPKSELTRCAAAYRRHLAESNTGGVGGGGGRSTDEEELTEDEERESREVKHQREIDDIIKSTIRSKSPPTADVHEGAGQTLTPRKTKSRDLEKALSRQRRERGERDREDRDRDRDRLHARSRRQGRGANELDVLDPMDPSAYSDTPRGKWSDGLNVVDELKKTTCSSKEAGKGSASKSKGGTKEGNDTENNDDENDDIEE